jgi:hypothetical protein
VIDIDEVTKARKEYEKNKEGLLNTNHVLKTLVDGYGIEAVSAASGLKLSSIVQYTTKKNSPKCSESTVQKAMTILSKF